MKKIIPLLSLSLFWSSSFSQEGFKPISFDQALLKAKETGQMIFLQFESASCDQCNEVADKAFEDKKPAVRLKEGFISIRISPRISQRNNVASFYNKESFFGSLFISSDGALIHTFPQTTSRADGNLQQIDIAFSKAGEGLRLNEFEKQYSIDNNEFFESPEAIDTYARLLYKTGDRNNAIEWELKAINLKKKRGYKTTAYEKVLVNMKARKPAIDN